MGFSDKQVRALGRSVPARNIRSRLSAGKELTYVEGWYVLAQANRIFGFDGWDRETIETKCILGREVRGSSSAVYAARVSITVRANGGVVVRDGHGTGEANGGSVGEVHDRALKAAETDATKRALATFGKAFGLALHASDRRPQHKPDRQAETVTARGVAVDALPSRVSANQPLNVAATSPASQAILGTGDNAAPMTTKGLAIRQRVEKSALAYPALSRVRDKDHLRFVASQPCVLCSVQPCDAHHVRFAQARAMGRKTGDDFTVPLCRAHHRELHHNGNEAAWWHDMGIDPLEVAKQLWHETERLSQRQGRPGR